MRSYYKYYKLYNCHGDCHSIFVVIETEYLILEYFYDKNCNINMPRKCVNTKSNFCYICEGIKFSLQKRNLMPLMKTAYHHYFGMKVGDQDKSFAPHICCNSCSVILREWLKGKKISIACSTHGLARAYKTCRRLLFLLNSANKSRIIIEKIGTVKYLNLPSAIRLIPHSDSLTVPTTPHIHEL
jgi:hypothetical protein